MAAEQDLRACEQNPRKRSVFSIAQKRQGVKYKWGGNSWKYGVDCSHFTMKVNQEAGFYYDSYLTTHSMKSLKSGRNGMVAVSADDLQEGDILVYGYYNKKGNWKGHTVIVVDQNYRYNGRRGLTVGSHGGGLGVRFITFNGFPNYYKKKHYKLRRVLRVKQLD